MPEKHKDLIILNALLGIAKKEGIHLSYKNIRKFGPRGVLVRAEFWLIIIDSTLALKQQIETLAHELGHYFKKHLHGDPKGTMIDGLNWVQNPATEREADEYGRNLIALMERGLAA